MRCVWDPARERVQWRSELVQRRIPYRILNRGLGRSRRGISYDPYDPAIREQIACQLYERRRDEQPLGTVARSRVILDILEESCPTQFLVDAYFENLEILLNSRAPLSRPGKIVVGLGTGRNGSTTLAALLQGVDQSCCTHENPPLVSWQPQRPELDFHFRRLEQLSRYFVLVADVAHWWLNCLDPLFRRFPDARAMGLVRDTAQCVVSFMRIKGFGRNSYNHWAPYGTGIWAAAQWDPTYPTYPLPPAATRDPDGVKRTSIERYVREYNEQLSKYASAMPNKLLLLDTTQLDDPAVQRRIFDFIGVDGRIGHKKLNVATVADGRTADLKF